MPDHCPLCYLGQIKPYHKDQKRSYLQCNHCMLVFVPKQFYLSQIEEKAEYNKHQNIVDDAGYRQFLSRLCSPLSQRLKPSAKGLDFGCGEGPALIALFEEQGFRMRGYDLYYRDDKTALDGSYDFITLTEVIEHLAAPREVLAQLFEMLEPQGKLGIMTKCVIDKEAFAKWHYKNDPTHIAFYSLATLEYVASWLNLELEQVGADAFIFTK